MVPAVTAYNLSMEVEEITHVVQWPAFKSDRQITHTIILTDSMNLLQKPGLGWTALFGTQPCTVLDCKSY